MSSRRVKIGSLFAGIGGLDKGIEDALRAAGLDVELAWQVEKNDFARAVLAKHWPGVNRSITDVRAASPLVLPRVDILVGGPPCQDNSGANPTGRGLDGSRSGLWWEYHRCIREFQPAATVVENVASGKSRWLCALRTSMHELGYRTAALGVSARDVGAPHLRERIFVVGWRTWEPVVGSSDLPPCECCGEPFCDLCELHYFECGCAGPSSDDRELRSEPWGDVAYPVRELAQGDGAPRDEEPRGEAGAILSGRGGPRGGADRRDRVAWSEPGMDRGADRVPARVDRGAAVPVRWPAGPGEPQHGWEPRRVKDDVPHQEERLVALGNAVVPACAEEVGWWIVQNVL